MNFRCTAIVFPLLSGLLLSLSAACSPALSPDTAPTSEAEMRASLLTFPEAPSSLKAVEGLRLKNQEVLAALSRVSPASFTSFSSRTSGQYAPLLSDLGDYDHYAQPYLLALMAQEARVSRGSKVLDIGLGNGYRAAVLAEVGARVYTLRSDSVPDTELTHSLRSRGYSVTDVTGVDSSESGPYDAILLSEMSRGVPPEVLSLLARNGRLLAPIHTDENEEVLLLVERTDRGFTSRVVGNIRLLPSVNPGITLSQDSWADALTVEEVFGRSIPTLLPQTAIESASSNSPNKAPAPLQTTAPGLQPGSYSRGRF